MMHVCTYVCHRWQSKIGTKSMKKWDFWSIIGTLLRKIGTKSSKNGTVGKRLLRTPFMTLVVSDMKDETFEKSSTCFDKHNIKKIACCANVNNRHIKKSGNHISNFRIKKPH